MRRLLLFWSLLCACSITHAAYAYSCQHQEMVELPIRDDGGYLSVVASINDTLVRLIVDTGAEGSLIREDFASHLSLPVDPHIQTKMFGINGGVQRVKNVIVRKLAVGREIFGPLSVPSGILPAMPMLQPSVEGLLGANILSLFDVDLDVASKKLTLYAHNAKCFEPPWQGAYFSVPMHRSGYSVQIPVKVNGQDVMAMLDSGARSRILSLQKAEKLGITKSELEANPGGWSMSGIDLRYNRYYWHTFDSFSVGELIEKRPTFTIIALHDNPDMLLGAEWLRSHRVWIGYSSGKLYIQAVEDAASEVKNKH